MLECNDYIDDRANELPEHAADLPAYSFRNAAELVEVVTGPFASLLLLRQPLLLLRKRLAVDGAVLLTRKLVLLGTLAFTFALFLRFGYRVEDLRLLLRTCWLWLGLLLS